jgi:hypothetical protein
MLKENKEKHKGRNKKINRLICNNCDNGKLLDYYDIYIYIYTHFFLMEFKVCDIASWGMS